MTRTLNLVAKTEIYPLLRPENAKKSQIRDTAVRLVEEAICQYTTPNGQVNLPESYWVEKMGVTKYTLRKAKAHLREAGVITLSKQSVQGKSSALWNVNLDFFISEDSKRPPAKAYDFIETNFPGIKEFSEYLESRSTECDCGYCATIKKGEKVVDSRPYYCRASKKRVGYLVKYLSDNLGWEDTTALISEVESELGHLRFEAVRQELVKAGL